MSNGSPEIPEIIQKQEEASTGLPTPSLETQLKTAQVGQQREEDWATHFNERVERMYEEKMRDLGSVPPPKLEDPAKEAGAKPDFKLSKQFIIASSALLALSAVGSMAMRNGADGMMVALTGALQGLHAGKKEVYDREMQKYNQLYKETLDKNQLELERYKTILNQKNKTLQEIVTEWNREWTHHGNTLKGYQYTIANINRLMTIKQNMLERFKQQAQLAEKKGAQLKNDMANYQFSTGQYAEQHGMSLEEAQKILPYFDYLQYMHPDSTISRGVRKKEDLQTYPGLRYGVKTKDELRDPTTLPEGTTLTTTEGLKYIIKDRKYTPVK